MKRMHAQGGFAYIAAIVFIVMLAGLALAILRLQATQQATIDTGVLGMRADHAARGGLEWALARLRTAQPADCAAIGARSKNTSTTLTDFRNDSGFIVTVTCDSRSYNEGQVVDSGNNLVVVVKTVFELEATACNGSAAVCPDAASVPRAGYVERRRTASFCAIAGGIDCD